MKLTKAFPLALVLALPLNLVSCGEKEQDKEPTSGDPAPTEAETRTHIEIAENVNVVLGEMMADMGAIKDEVSANKFSENMDGYVDQLKDLLAEARELPAPSDEVKAEIKKIKEASDKMGDETMAAFGKMMESSPDAEVIGEALQKAFQNEEMDETMNGFEELYNLEEEEGEE